MRVPVPLAEAWRLVNHAPVTLVSASHDGADNVMAAAWVMLMDYDPPKLAAVLASDTYTAALAVRAGEVVVQVPPRALVAAVDGVGTTSGREVDKWARFGLGRMREAGVGAPLVEGCVAWIAARLAADQPLAAQADLYVLEGFAAWADDRAYDGARLRDDVPAELRALHHASGGRYVVCGDVLAVRSPRG